MCGIMGYYSFGQRLPDKEKITKMFSLLETRGRDASGFAFIKNGNLIVHKAAINSSLLVKDETWQSLILPQFMILHTRMKTQGTEKNNQNNHPLFSKSGIAIVHNGIIYNDREIFGKKQRDAEVDSECILHLLSLKIKGDKIKRLFDKVEGSFAIAAIDKNEPDSLMLVKKDNPLVLYYNDEYDILYFCSERQIMQEALNIESVSMRGFTLGEKQYHFYEMQNNYALTLNSEGVESYQRYFPKTRSWSRDYFGEGGFEELVVDCPWCFSRTKYYDGKLFNKCEICGMGIYEEDLYPI